MSHIDLRPTTTSTTLGERKLPKGRALITLAVAAFLAGCSSAGKDGAHIALAATSSSAPPAAIASFAIPTLGTTPPSGLVLPSYFVTLLAGRNGSLRVLAAPGSRCALTVTAVDGTPRSYPAAITDASGTATFAYTPVAGVGESIQTVTCELGNARDTAEGRVLLP